MSKKRFLLAVLLGCVLSLGAVKAHAQQPDDNRPVSALFKEAKVAPSPQAKSALLEEMRGKAPQSAEDTVAMIDALDDPDFDVQDAAVMMVMRVKEPKAAAKLLDKVRGLPSGKMKAADMTQEDAKKAGVGSDAALVLSEMQVAEALPVIVSKLGDAATPGLFDERVVGVAAVKYGRAAIPVVKKKLKLVGRSNQHGRMLLLAVIMNMTDKAAAAELRDLYDSSDLDMKSAAARGLRNIGEKVDVSKLIQAVKEGDAKPYVSGWSETEGNLLDEIGYAGNPDAIPFLKEKIDKRMKEDSQSPNYYDEVLALSRIGGQDVFEYLLGLYKEARRDNERHTIIMAFGRGKMQESVGFLNEVMNDRSTTVGIRLDAARGMEMITGQDYTKIKDEIREGKR